LTGYGKSKRGFSALERKPHKDSPALQCLLALPVHWVDATPSDQLVRQYFPGRTDLFG
jgi:hypothetical protein